ncbi:MAG: hypothetical protein PHG05_02665 [Candidatus Nanoarchaeia archaeon]|nr:hypothetical protein [Candidatus Nanoarchaeia archaeon]
MEEKTEVKEQERVELILDLESTGSPHSDEVIKLGTHGIRKSYWFLADIIYTSFIGPRLRLERMDDKKFTKYAETTIRKIKSSFSFMIITTQKTPDSYLEILMLLFGEHKECGSIEDRPIKGIIHLGLRNGLKSFYCEGDSSKLSKALEAIYYHKEEPEEPEEQKG